MSLYHPSQIKDSRKRKRISVYHYNFPDAIEEAFCPQVRGTHMPTYRHTHTYIHTQRIVTWTSI